MFGLGKVFDQATGLEREYGPILIGDHQLACQVCRHGIFWRQQAQLHTPVASFFGLDFANRIANCAVCAQCGYVHWFLPVHAAPEPAEQAGDDGIDAAPA